MKRQFVLIVVSAIVGATAAVGGLGSAERGRATAAPPTNIEAKFTFVDDGTTLKVFGIARGMASNETYASLIYDVGSVAEGPRACVPSILDPTDPDFIGNTMFLGLWEVDADGRGKLSALNTNGGIDFVPLSKIGSVSVRRLLDGGPTVLEACGAVRTDGDDKSDDDKQ
jgi:hypothetical protein